MIYIRMMRADPLGALGPTLWGPTTGWKMAEWARATQSNNVMKMKQYHNLYVQRERQVLLTETVVLEKNRHQIDYIRCE